MDAVNHRTEAGLTPQETPQELFVSGYDASYRPEP